MTIVHNSNGSWQRASGVLTLKRMVSTRTVTYADGRQEQEDCTPYPVDETVDLGKIERLVADGVWGDKELTTYGLKVAVPFIVPEGKQRIGDPHYVESNGVVNEEYDVEDIPPPPPPPPPPTAEQKLAALGLTREELRTLVAEDTAIEATRK